MTAEVGVINRRGVALAADSAVTINRSKVTNSAVKLYTLDSAHYVGIMIFGNAGLQNVPWEAIIKSYREKLGNKVFDKLNDYIDSFKTYVSLLKIWNTQEARWSMVQRYVYTIISTINEFVKDNRMTLDKSISETRKLISAQKYSDIDKDRLNNDFKAKIISEFKNTFTTINENQCDKCVKLVIDCLVSDFSPNDYTGIVFAGYGKSEMFPSICKLLVDGVIDGKVRISNFEVTTCDPLKSDTVASIMPFAQSDVMKTVIYGIAPELDNFRKQQLDKLKGTITNCFPEEQQRTIEELFNSYDQMFDRHSQSEYTTPITSMLKNLSVSELGNMAEMLVNLTAFKRKFSDDIGTVGGPIDVLTISKGEGPIWIKRKEYFDKDLNEGYTLRRR